MRTLKSAFEARSCSVKTSLNRAVSSSSAIGPAPHLVRDLAYRFAECRHAISLPQCRAGDASRAPRSIRHVSSVRSTMRLPSRGVRRAGMAGKVFINYRRSESHKDARHPAALLDQSALKGVSSSISRDLTVPRIG